MYMESPEQWRERQKIKAEEENKEYFYQVSEHFGEALDKLGVFNSLYYERLGDGITCYMSLKKYPNVFTSFRYSIDNIPQTITFDVYMHMFKWSRVSIPFIGFLDMVGFEPPKKKTIWNRIFKKREKKHIPKLFTYEKLEYLIEENIRNYGYDLEPGLFHFESPGLSISLDWNKDEAKKFLDCDKSVYYAYDGDKVVEYIIEPNYCQKKLMKLYVGDYEQF